MDYRILGSDGKEYGPVSAEQLRQWVAEGRANAQSRVLPEGATEWRSLADIPELMAAAAPPVSVAPMTGTRLAPGTVPNYLVQAILVTICCCLPFGIPAIVFAGQVNTKLAAGDLGGAQESSRKAKMWCWLGFGFGILGNLIACVFYAITTAAQIRSMQ